MKYEVTYLTVNGNFNEKFRTEEEAKEFAVQVKELKAVGVRVKELA